MSVKGGPDRPLQDSHLKQFCFPGHVQGHKVRLLTALGASYKFIHLLNPCKIIGQYQSFHSLLLLLVCFPQ